MIQIGNKLRRLRKLRGLTIEELAEKANITKGFISQLERDLTAPSVTTLKQILDVLGVELSSFFSDLSEHEKNIFTRRDRMVDKSTDKYTVEHLIPKMKYLEMEPVVITLQPVTEYRLHFAEDEGFGFVVRGNLEIRIDQEVKRVNHGDCFYIFFDSTLLLKNLSKKNAEILIVNY